MTHTYWDSAAAAFDDEPDHGLRDPAVRSAWAQRLQRWLSPNPGRVLDFGCGTGSLSLLAVEQGQQVTAVDSAPAMLERARAKLAGTSAVIRAGDAARPPVGAERFDAVLVRHVLWMLPEPGRVLRHWASLLRPEGRLVLVEGRWGESAPIGLSAADALRLVAPIAWRTQLEQLADDPLLWGGPVHDERYALLAYTAPAPAPNHIADARQ